MINGLLPLGSLKRDEIYTFIAGLYVSVVWIIYLSKCFPSISAATITLLNSCIFIVSWLTSAVILFVIQLYLSSVIRLSLQRYCNGVDDDKLLKTLELGTSRVNYFNHDYCKELIVYIHIIGLCMTSALLVTFPALRLLSFDVRYMIALVVTHAVLVALLFYQYHRFWLYYCTFGVLRRKGRVEVYDEKKYSEEMSISIAKENITFNKELDALTRNNKLSELVEVLTYSCSLSNGVEEGKADQEWKWSAVVKVSKTANRMYLDKYAFLTYSLYDAGETLLAMDVVAFDDAEKIKLEPDSEEMPCDEGSVLLGYRSRGTIPTDKANQISFSNCRIMFKWKLQECKADK